MSGAVAVSGQDVVVVDGRVISDLADGDCWMIDFPNDMGVAKASKNGNTIYARDEKGRMGEVTIRVLLGSADDKYLNSRFQQWNQDSSAFQFFSGYFSKRIGHGDGGQVDSKVYTCAGGVPKKQVPAKTSAEGDSDQSVAVYSITFANAMPVVQ